jgi:TolA-binding protein
MRLALPTPLLLGRCDDVDRSGPTLVAGEIRAATRAIRSLQRLVQHPIQRVIQRPIQELTRRVTSLSVPTRIRPAVCVAAVVTVLVLLFLHGAAPVRAAALQTTALPENIRQLYNSARYAEAARELEAAIDANPKDASLPYWLGRCFYELQEFAQSIANFERAVSLDPNRSEFHDWLGKAWGRKAEETGRLAAFSAISTARKASREFALAVNLDANNLEAQRDLIRYLMNAPGIAGGSEDRAQQQINALEKIDPVEGGLARAELYATHKKFDQADAEYQKILNMPVRRVGPAFEAAEYYRDREDAQHMEQAENLAAKIDPSDRRLNYYRGVMLVLTRRDLDAAEKALRSYLDAVPSSAEAPPHSSAYMWLGRLYEQKGQPDKAAEAYQAALMLDPHDKAARDALKRIQKN